MSAVLEMPLDEQLREAIAASGLSANQLAKQTGLHQTVISDFIRGESDLRLSSIMKLTDFLKLRLAPDDPDDKSKKRRG